MPHQEDLPESGFSSGKKSPSWTFSSPSVVGHFLGRPFGPHLTGTTGEICRTQPLGDTRVREGDGFTATSAQISEDHIPPAVVPGQRPSQQLCPLAEPNHLPYLTRELGWQFCLTWIPSQEATPVMKPVLQPCSAREANFQSLSNC